MQIDYTKAFKKQYHELPKKVQRKFAERLELFLRDSDNSLLHVHNLTGNWREHTSFNVTGDVRAVFIINETDKVILFVAIGSHSELYG